MTQRVIMASEVTPGVDVKEAEELALSLSEALNSGDEQEAVQLCQRLSQLSVQVTVSVTSKAYLQDSIRLRVGVEDAQSDVDIPVIVVVSSSMTIAQLKEQVSQEYGFPPPLQRWVIGKRLAGDQETLHSHGVRRDGDQAFLFIPSANNAHLTLRQHKQDEQQQRLDGRVCTFVNKPTRPGCEMCGGDRPGDYRVPDVYRPDQEEVHRLQQETLATLQYEQAKQEERNTNFLHLLATEKLSLFPNAAATDCPICFSPLAAQQGVTLRECLHTFCRDCLKATIVNSQDAEVSCPEACDSKLLDREINALLTDEERQRFQDLRLSIAESRSEHSFHCQTPNCRGWCIYEDEVNHFHCALCNQTNCILCRAIHNDMNCKDYQDDLRARAINDQAAQQTEQMLESLLQNGEAMKCPRCDIVIQKKDGCDWICCLMCKTEVCWVTKQARWGPKGSGDTSGGCRCRVNNQPCHPNCQNCH
ncbi:RanBP-type and C3HC4-type zinc finger-containing protein 1 [Liparis tanakae]|uniref:RanBP-type and C3HC4-type zinc finger-containing protein 1 n=1 Tax=Liparis tanakae TaxID=230148 RepID=A0A4Z2ILS5_9TELE|nr:RanBP-type and C3HC4-type zinc finger-containing protein 1 [Liparis tanakae]